MKRLIAVWAAVAVLVCGGVAAQLAGQASADNTALLDTARTDQAIAAVSEAVNRLFSYDHADLAATSKAADSLLADQAKQEYRELFKDVEAKSAEQKLTLTTRVVRAGVTRLDADRAQLVVFADQWAVRGGGAPTATAAQLEITARQQGTKWIITQIHAE
ncbi:hypothetical protein D5S17_33570 [Pseudonocardiaceae bacterium YIM PH 21723]|nr:hypothetical protein D5S17_33570 [Pseudonocardiaceae bacterium YIM PH 21723]